MPVLTARPAGDEAFEMVHHFGGTHHGFLIHDSHWLQLFGSSLLELDRSDANTVAGVSLGSDSVSSGIATDMLIFHGQLYVVLKDQGVVSVDVNVFPYEKSSITTTEELGILPRTLSVVDNEIYASGVGGIVQLSDRSNIFPTPDQVPGRVILADDQMVTTLGRRVFRVKDRKYCGSATELLPLPDVQGLDRRAAMVFIRQSESDFEIGLMSADCREIAPPLKLAGEYRSFHASSSGTAWLTTSDGVHQLEFKIDHLELLNSHEIKNAIDAGPLSDDGTLDKGLAVVGAFGRAIFPQSALDGPLTFDKAVALHRELSHVSGALAEERSILLSTSSGTFRWSLADSTIDFLSADAKQLPGAAQRASTVHAAATIGDDHRAMEITSPVFEAIRWAHPGGATLNTVVAVNGEFLVGHSRGVSVLRVAPKRESTAQAELRLVAEIESPSAITFLIPVHLAGGGVAFISEDSGVGIIHQLHP
ncbi:MAG TPA: hypothetical protein VG711_02905 [Phycisphaerales bacterium]|nr:hypothetical protein [Phycisphaerales bacterium]